ncbi:hypothetical protein OS175_11035 [Marinicella sp. S1101]|uniref:hypothetical protein n=1 Tax=Marinicella marina TaxID=2996016 RepID=UPI0022608C44|nr:hypothetical protein [Marinicella marina]MCX7554417.1 hypothetical protein [Marinicella marina]MDJ1140568.1 hypothetical protein [Marinicella marina]
MSHPKKDNHPETDRVRLLEPSFSLYLWVGVVVFMVWVILIATVIPSGYVIPVVIVLSVAPSVAVKPVAHLIAKIAEQKKARPGLWFKADAEREKRRYGPLRAHRLFGHKIGTKKKWTDKPK